MKFCSLALALILASSCASHSSLPAKDSAVNQPTPVSPTPTPTATDNIGDAWDEIEETVIPAEFKGIDFANRSYPTTFRRGIVRLRDGECVIPDPESGGDTFNLTDVYYADVNDDGRKEAIVHLRRVSCGASCDGGSSLFYFYSIKGRTLTLLWRIESGSPAYRDCGLKSFVLEKQKLVFETFQACRVDGTLIKPIPDPHPSQESMIGKFFADKFTRFDFDFEGNRFHLKKREVFPNPKHDIGSHEPMVKISND